jgi:predicted permease
MPTDVGQIFLAAVAGMATILIISSVGVHLALRPAAPRPVLNPDALRQISRLLVAMCWPAMAFYSIGKTLNGEKLADLWPLLVMPLVNVALGGAGSMILCSLLKTKAHITPAVVVGGAWGNSAALPLVLLSALCQQPILSDVEDCDDLSLAYIMMYTIPWSVTWFVVAMPILGVVASTPAQDDDDSARRPTFSLLKLECNSAAWAKALLAGPMIGTYLGVGCALWPWLQENLFYRSSVLRPFGLAIESCTMPAINLFTLVMAASLVPPPLPPATPSAVQNGSANPARTVVPAKESVGEMAVQEVKVDGDRSLEQGSVAKEFDLKLGLALTLLRLVLLPIAGLGVQYAIVKLDFMPFNKLGLLICYLEMVVPSAQMGIVCLHQLGASKLASQLAQLVALQYALAAFTLTMFTALAIYLVEEQLDYLS